MTCLRVPVSPPSALSHLVFTANCDSAMDWLSFAFLRSVFTSSHIVPPACWCSLAVAIATWSDDVKTPLVATHSQMCCSYSMEMRLHVVICLHNLLEACCWIKSPSPSLNFKPWSLSAATMLRLIGEGTPAPNDLHPIAKSPHWPKFVEHDRSART